MIQLSLDTKSIVEFSTQRPTISDDDKSSDEQYKWWRDLFWFIKDEKICINLQINDKEDIIKKVASPEYSLVRYLLDKCTKADNKVNRIDGEAFISIDKPPFCKLSLLSKNISDNSIAYNLKDGEVLENWKNFRTLFSRNIGLEFETDKVVLSSWYDLNTLVKKCNSLIIADNYLLSYWPAMKNNFLKMLRAFKPESEKINFQVVIISSSFYRNGSTEEEISKVYNRLVKGLQSNGFGKFELMLVKATINDQHDRYIYTNYDVVHSGHSFNYFDRDGHINLKQPTTITSRPHTLTFSPGINSNVKHLNNSKQESMFSIEQYKGFLIYYKNLIERTLPKNKVGNVQSRLFEGLT